MVEGFGSGANVEDVEAGVQKEGHVEVFGDVGREEGDVKGVVLGDVSWGYGRRELWVLTYFPMMPMQAMAGEELSAIACSTAIVTLLCTAK